MSNQEDELLEYEELENLDDDDEEPTYETEGEVSQPSMGKTASPSSASIEKKEPYKANRNSVKNNKDENKKTEGTKTREQKNINPYKGKDNNSNPANKKTLSKDNRREKNLQANKNAIKNPKQAVANKFKGKKSLTALGAKAKNSVSGASSSTGGNPNAKSPLKYKKRPTDFKNILKKNKSDNKGTAVAKNTMKKIMKKNPYVMLCMIGVAALLFILLMVFASSQAAGGDEDPDKTNTSYGNVTIKDLCNEVTVYFEDSETPEIYDLEDYIAYEVLDEIYYSNLFDTSLVEIIAEDSVINFERKEDKIYIPSDNIKAFSIYMRTSVINTLKENDSCEIHLDEEKKEYDDDLLEIVGIGVGNTRGLVMMDGDDFYNADISILTYLTDLSIFDKYDVDEEIPEEEKTKKEIIVDELLIDEEEFELKQIFYEKSTNTLAIYMNYNTLCNTATVDANVITFIKGWEGNTGYCDGGMGYNAKNVGDTTVTAGYGVTNALIGDLTNYINEKNYGQYFNVRDSGSYYMNIGDCIPVTVIDDLMYVGFEKIFFPSIERWQANNPDIVITQYQKDAILTFSYNLGTSSTESILNAYKEGGYEGLWQKMSKYVNYKNDDGEMVESDGLKKRRKGEFALFVTGDYTDQGLFYSRGLDNYDDFNSEGVLERETVCQIADENGLQVDINTGFVMRVSRPLRENAIYYDQNSPAQLAYTNYEGECAWYAGHRAKEILAQTNSTKDWGHMPDGKDYCRTPEVTSGTFKSSNDVNQPKQGALISWDNGTWGHVAVIEKVNEDGSITVSEGSIGYGSVANRSALHNMYPQYGDKLARKMNCEGNGSGCFNTKTISKEKISDGFVCYIYLLD